LENILTAFQFHILFTRICLKWNGSLKMTDVRHFSKVYFLISICEQFLRRMCINYSRQIYWKIYIYSNEVFNLLMLPRNIFFSLLTIARKVRKYILRVERKNFTQHKQEKNETKFLSYEWMNAFIHFFSFCWLCK
jgi:hypothetical protein